MPNFPASIFAPRVLVDRVGAVYDSSKTKVFFAKDHNDPLAEIVAIQNALGVNLSNVAVLAGVNGGQIFKGGSGVTDILKLQSTSGNGTLTSPGVQVLVGNNGATIASTVLNNGFYGFGTVTPTSIFTVNKTASDTISVENAAFSFGQNAGLGAGLIGQQLVSSPYGFAIQAQNYVNTGPFPIILNPLGGNVGIMTKSPRATLEVNNTSLAFNIEQFRIGCSDGTKYLSMATNLIQYVAGNSTSTFLSIGTNVGASPTGDGGSVKIFTGSNVLNTIFDRNGNVGIGVTAMTARFHLPASTAAANTASLKIDAGVVATTPVSGNIESDGTHLYWTDSGNTRKQLDN
jgi:hypothetical protein